MTTTTYSFTEKKRIRKDFGKRPPVLDVPYLLAIQVDSYREFLQANVDPNAARGQGPARRAEVGVPDLQLLAATPRSNTSSYRLGEPAFDERECRYARHELRRAAARDRAPGDLRQGSPLEQGRSST